MSAHPIARRTLVGTVASAAVVGAVLLPAAAASAAPRSQAAPAATFAWHPLSLINGWQPFGNGDATPGYAISGGVVYLRGAMLRPAGSSTADFAVLPAAAHPSHAVHLVAYTANVTTGDLGVAPDGEMQITSDSAGDAFAFTSLSGVHYPVSGFTWHKLTLINGWISGDGSYGTGDPAYAIKNGVVYLSGSLNQVNGTNNEFAVLPKAARSGHNMYISVVAGQLPPGQIDIGSNGRMFAQASPQQDARSFTSLAGISYPTAQATWHKLTLIHGWISTQNAYGTGNPAYTVIGGVVYLTGGVVQPKGSNFEFAVLPSAARPAHDLQIPDYVSHAGGAGGFGATPQGVAIADSNPLSNAQQFTILAAISYPKSS